jgi:hypothetical protein
MRCAALQMPPWLDRMVGSVLLSSIASRHLQCVELDRRGGDKGGLVVGLRWLAMNVHAGMYAVGWKSAIWGCGMRQGGGGHKHGVLGIDPVVGLIVGY